ncbi:hypothetical protein [Sphaerothrix gracilis]|uniref:hypothetical protein n=1 Tax=Sphaerothrix gracilis TaxID=3151835 RepID=UPI0031FBBB98
MTALILFLLLRKGIYFYQQIDSWLLLGVSAIVARLWAYYLVYDDMLILLPIVVLLGLQKQGLPDLTAQSYNELLPAIAILINLLPTSLRLVPAPPDPIFNVGVTLSWILMPSWLALQAARQRRQQILV